MVRFADLGIAPGILESIEEIGYEEPSPIQVRAIPCLLAGRDVVAQALTGTGKTAAFGIPIIQQSEPRRAETQAIVLAPTRELTVQVSEQLTRLSSHSPVLIVPIYGGQPIERQLRALKKGAQIIVATPGRLMDHMQRRTVDLGAVRTLVLDEADQMLDMGFLDDVEYIMERMPAKRQMALFSATLPDAILKLTRRFMHEPEIIRLSKPRELTVPAIEQVYYQVPFRRKIDALVRVLEARTPERTLVFCATKRMVDDLTVDLRGRGFEAAGLHGDMPQSVRQQTLEGFRRGTTEVLVATDVAARGLHVTGISLVVNFDIPSDAEAYVHRIGRTGRVGKPGVAITFVNPWEMRELRVIERITGARIRRGEVPTAHEIAEREREILEENLERTLLSGRWGQYRPVVEELADEHDPIDIAAAALAMAVKQPRRGTKPATGARQR